MHNHSKILLGFYIYKAYCKSVKYPFNSGLDVLQLLALSLVFPEPGIP